MAFKPSLSPIFLLALAVAPALSACATTQTVSEQLSDDQINATVAARLAADPDVAKADVDVDVIDSVVTLRGEVDNIQSWVAAENVALRTKGVLLVHNRIKIVPNNELIETDGDGRLTAKVSSRLAVDPDVKARNIDVDTQDAEVTLSGVVESYEARREAVSIALNTEGVRSVSNELQVDMSL